VDKLTIDTPEQVHLEFELAGIGSRFMALLVDSLIQGLMYLVLGITAGVLMASLFASARTWVGAVAIFVVFLIYWGYFVLFETFWKGQTPGKRVAKIRVIKDSGRPISAFESMSRNLLRVADGFPGFYGVGVITMLLNKQNRRLGDFVAGTLVVHETSDKESALFFNTAESTDFIFPQAAKMTLQEAELIEAFLARRLDIPPAVRQQNGQRIAEMLAARLSIPADARPADNENFLEILVREFRNRARLR
jgi:uncharacterized RDD family membrane protein YckC